MKRILVLISVVLFASSPVYAASAKSYQVTGPVLELTDAKIVVQKGQDKWELERNAATKLPPDVKVGSKVTVYYTMTATEVESKDAGKKEAAPAKKK